MIAQTIAAENVGWKADWVATPQPIPRMGMAATGVSGVEDPPIALRTQGTRVPSLGSVARLRPQPRISFRRKLTQARHLGAFAHRGTSLASHCVSTVRIGLCVSQRDAR